MGGLGLGVPQDALAWEDPPSSCSGLGRKHVTVAGVPRPWSPAERLVPYVRPREQSLHWGRPGRTGRRAVGQVGKELDTS